jgi:hypothetical protein
VPGDDWHHAIKDALGKSDAMVVLVTAASMESRGVRSEIDFALGSSS